MAAKKSKQAGTPVVIVESPAKARTIAKFLGSGYRIEASIGHVRDLPPSAAEIPAKYKKEKWSRIGIDVENGFTPLYVVPKEKREHMKKLRALVQDASVVYLATDEDREGESISWHLVQELEPTGEIRRLVFHEITKEAIHHALENPRQIDQDLVNAQETRRLVDRLYGYEVSPLLWRKIKPRLSAGRVQSVAVRLVVERELERIRFVAADYWDLIGTFEADGQAPFDATLVSVAGQRLAVGKDFDPDTGKLKTGASDRLHLDEAAAHALANRLAGQDARVESLEQKPYTEKPSPPFTTSTLQQDGGRKLGFTARRTMRAAQRLYENGYITYMRTDSTTLSSEALNAARQFIKDQYGAENLPDEPRTYRTKVKNAQEAHEAIRPAGASFTPINQIGGDMGDDERRLYELIFKRTVASQMLDAKGKQTTLTLTIDDARFSTSGRTIEFPGFRLAYSRPAERPAADESGDDPADRGETADKERLLPNVAEGDRIGVRELSAGGHTTKPPARLTEATLIREMEARGIGRPSTYASIIETILSRDYCFKKGAALVPTLTAFAVVRLLSEHLEWLVNYDFTAKMENDLDEISNGEKRQLDYLTEFYVGNGHPGLKEQLAVADKAIDPRDICTVRSFQLGEFEGQPIEVRVGRYGPFLACGPVSASLPDELAPDELTRERAFELVQTAAAGPKSLGSDPETGLKIFVKVGRFGPYFQRGDAESLGDEKPKMASLLKTMDPETATLEDALAVLALPRNLGAITLPDGEPGAGETHDVLACDGRFGPYLKCGKATRSLRADDHLLTVSLQRAVELFAEPKQAGRRAKTEAKVLREIGEHPVSKRAVRILDGRYGPYISDGEVNANVPRDEDADGMGLARAIELLDARAKSPKRKKKTTKTSSVKKPASGKKATAKKATAKKTTKKKKPAESSAETADDDD